MAAVRHKQVADGRSPIPSFFRATKNAKIGVYPPARFGSWGTLVDRLHDQGAANTATRAAGAGILPGPCGGPGCAIADHPARQSCARHGHTPPGPGNHRYGRGREPAGRRRRIGHANSGRTESAVHTGCQHRATGSDSRLRTNRQTGHGNAFRTRTAARHGDCLRFRACNAGGHGDADADAASHARACPKAQACVASFTHAAGVLRTPRGD